jgi:hypothetical protein
MSTEESDPIRELCYSIVETTIDDAESFQFLCPDGSYTNADLDFKCITTLGETQIPMLVCPTSITMDSVTYTNIRTEEGTPNVCDEGVDANGISNCLDPATGAPLHGYLVEPTCTVIIETSYESCNGVLTENTF